MFRLSMPAGKKLVSVPRCHNRQRPIQRGKKLVSVPPLPVGYARSSWSSYKNNKNRNYIKGFIFHISGLAAGKLRHDRDAVMLVVESQLWLNSCNFDFSIETWIPFSWLRSFQQL
jgi:hypothetical protein